MLDQASGWRLMWANEKENGIGRYNDQGPRPANASLGNQYWSCTEAHVYQGCLGEDIAFGISGLRFPISSSAWLVSDRPP